MQDGDRCRRGDDRRDTQAQHQVQCLPVERDGATSDNVLRERILKRWPRRPPSVTPKRLSDLSTGRRRVKYSPSPSTPRRPTHLALDLVRPPSERHPGRTATPDIRSGGASRAIEEKTFAKQEVGATQGLAGRRPKSPRQCTGVASVNSVVLPPAARLRAEAAQIQRFAPPRTAHPGLLNIGTTTRWSAGPLVMESTRLTMRRRAVAVAPRGIRRMLMESKALRCAPAKKMAASNRCVPISRRETPGMIWRIAASGLSAPKPDRPHCHVSAAHNARPSNEATGTQHRRPGPAICDAHPSPGAAS